MREVIYHRANYWNNKTALSFAFFGTGSGAFHPSQVKYSAVFVVVGERRAGRRQWSSASKQKVKP